MLLKPNLKRLLLACCFLSQVNAFCQPLWNTRRAIGDQVVVQDIKLKNKYYYAPRKLELKTDADGKPVFQLISMRYTGTQLTGDKAEKRFTNLLQFSVTQPAVTAQELKEVAATFQLPPAAQLTPMPIRNMEAVIVSGVGEGIADGKLHKRAEVHAEANDGKSVLWSERSFVMPLDNYEAQILWDQYKNGRLAVSLNYAFFADVMHITEDELKVDGDSAFVETMKNAAGELERDTLEALEAVCSNVLDISIDLNKWPTALKQIDINENSVPPAYPSLEVKCFDFSYDTRPDLAYKRVFVEGTTVSNQLVQEKVKFSRGSREITTQFVAFRYALRMDRPLRYKVIDGGIDGEEKEGSWIQMEKFANLIDASTQQKRNQMSRHCVDVEVQPESFSNDNLQQISVRFLFDLNGKSYSQRLDFPKGQEPLLKTVCITHDMAKPVKYFVLREFVNGAKSKGLVLGMPGDGYVLVPK